MFIHALGIDTEGSGFRNIIIKPTVSREMNELKGSYRSINGTISTAWNWEDDRFTLKISVPANTSAKVIIPASESSSIREGDNSLEEVREVEILKVENEQTTVSIGSGDYIFTSTLE